MGDKKSHKHEQHKHSTKDQKICQECRDWMRKSAEKCRSWREKSESAVCKGGLATAALVCEALAISMEKCMETLKQNET